MDTTPPKKSSIWVLILRPVLFWGLAVFVAFGAYSFTRDLTTCWRLTPIPGIAPAQCGSAQANPLEGPVISGPTPTPTSTPEPEAPEAEYPTWDGASRINILFVGLRGGDPTEQDCPFCTDTLILLTVDPVTKTAGMLSIPRDLWVNIPGFGYSRINTAWSLGRGSRLPGGGPTLAMKTISHFIGVPVDYYVQVDFDTFVDIVDMLGGLDVYVDETVILDPVADGKDYPKKKLTCCGVRHINGRIALAYARCRHQEQGCSDGDFGRARRQQKVIFAIRDKVLDPANFPTLFPQAPKLYNKFSEGIHTNLAIEDAMKLAMLVKDIPVENIKHAVIDEHMVIGDSTTLGGLRASVLRPLPDEVRILRDEIFTTSGPLSPLAKGDLGSLMQADGARIRILNGTSSPNLDTRTGTYLTGLGAQVTEFGTTKTYSRTTIILYSPKLYTLRFLQDVFDISHSTQILIKLDPAQTVDMEIRLGGEWISKLPPE